MNALPPPLPHAYAPVPRPARPQPRTPPPRWSRRHSFELVDGHVLAPTRPGLGITLRRDVVREITVPV